MRPSPGWSFRVLGSVAVFAVLAACPPNRKYTGKAIPERVEMLPGESVQVTLELPPGASRELTALVAQTGGLGGLQRGRPSIEVGACEETVGQLQCPATVRAPADLSPVPSTWEATLTAVNSQREETYVYLGIRVLDPTSDAGHDGGQDADAGQGRDAGPGADGGATDAGLDDAGLPDAGPSDAGLSDAGAAPTIIAFTATPSMIAAGGSSVLEWSVALTDPSPTCTIEPGALSAVVPSGYTPVSPAASTTYTLTCTNAVGSASATTTVQLVGNMPPDGTITSPPAPVTVEAGDSVTFAASCTDDNAGGTSLAHAWSFDANATADSSLEDPGAIRFPLPGTYVVTYTCQDALGADDPTPATVTVTVTEPRFAVVRAAQSGADAPHTCGLTTGGKLFCWGALGPWLGLGTGVTTNVLRPTQVGTATSWVSLEVGAKLTCAINAGQELHCAGYREGYGVGQGADTPAWTLTRVGAAADWAQVSIGQEHVCAVKLGGTLHCWGLNRRGELGLSDLVERTTFTQVGTDTDWVSVSAGTSLTCALKTGNRAWCWGLNDYGQVGDSSTTNRLVPVEIGASIDWTFISAGNAVACGVDLAHKLYCWGYDGVGQLGDGTPGGTVAEATKVPTQTGTATDWAEVTTGFSHTCARKTSGAIACFGSDYAGQLGDGMPGQPDSVTPVPVGAASDWSSVVAGNLYTCGVRNGDAWCWGSNFNGILGNGAQSPFGGNAQHSAVPVRAKMVP